MSDNNFKLHKHEHPSYQWIALVFAGLAIFVAAGLSYLAYTNFLQDEYVYSVQSTGGVQKADKITETTSLDSDASVIEKDLNSITDTVLQDSTLDNSQIGL